MSAASLAKADSPSLRGAAKAEADEDEMAEDLSQDDGFAGGVKDLEDATPELVENDEVVDDSTTEYDSEQNEALEQVSVETVEDQSQGDGFAGSVKDLEDATPDVDEQELVENAEVADDSTTDHDSEQNEALEQVSVETVEDQSQGDGFAGGVKDLEDAIPDVDEQELVESDEVAHDSTTDHDSEQNEALAQVSVETVEDQSQGDGFAGAVKDLEDATPDVDEQELVEDDQVADIPPKELVEDDDVADVPQKQFEVEDDEVDDDSEQFEDPQQHFEETEALKDGFVGGAKDLEDALPDVDEQELVEDDEVADDSTTDDDSEQKENPEQDVEDEGSSPEEGFDTTVAHSDPL